MATVPLNNEAVVDGEDEHPVRGLSPLKAASNDDGRNQANTDAYDNAARLSIPPVVFTPARPSVPPTNVSSSSSNNANTELGSSGPKPRPRPRPAYKGTKATTPSTSSSATRQDAGPSGADASASAAGASTSTSASDVADTIRVVNASEARNLAQDLDPMDWSQDIAERAKLRSRSRSAKSQQPTTPALDDVIDISSDDELQLHPSVPKKSTDKTKVPTVNRHTKVPEIFTIPETQETDFNTLPVPTSDFDPHPSSQLPPSDPPPPTSSTRHEGETSFDGPLSPLSSPEPKAVQKRKRPIPPMLDENTGRRSVNDENLMPPPPLPPPPPPFFASSPTETLVESASSKRTSYDGGREEPPIKPRRRRKGAEDDEEDWVASPKKKAKTRTRKKVNEDEDEWAEETAPKPVRKPRKKVVNDEDEWDGDELPVSKAKAKTKATAKRGKKGEHGKTMEVVIVSPKKGPKGKGKNTPKPPVEEALDEEIVPPTFPAPEELPPISPPPEPPRQTHTESALDDEDLAMTAPPSRNKGKGKKRVVGSSDEEDEEPQPPGSPPKRPRVTKGRKSAPAMLDGSTEQDEEAEGQDGDGSRDKIILSSKIGYSERAAAAFKSPLPSSAATVTPRPKFSQSNRAYSIAPNRSTPMSELIKKANSQPCSPYPAQRPTHTPYAKASKSFLRKIAPLHPNRRTPPPPPPRLPPPKKSKKQLELEEKWEMELEDSVEGWYCLPEEERAALRRAKRDAEMGFED